MTINSITIKTPSAYKWGKFKIFSSDSGRTESGTNKLSIVTQKRKLYCKWSFGTQAELETLLNLIDPDVSGTTLTTYIPLLIDFTDPITGINSTGYFQTGDVEVDALKMDISKNVIEWINLTANFIEI